MSDEQKTYEIHVPPKIQCRLGWHEWTKWDWQDAMKVCKSFHREVCYDEVYTLINSGNCPLCESLKEIDDLENKVFELESKISNLESVVEERSKPNDD